MVASDHRPVVAFLEDKVTRRRGLFRFDKRWIGQDGFMESIATGWRDHNEGQSEDLVSKISSCRHEIASWRKITLHMERTKFKTCREHWKRSNPTTIGRKKRFLRFLGNCRKHIKMRRSTGIRKVEICGIHLGI